MPKELHPGRIIAARLLSFNGDDSVLRCQQIAEMSAHERQGLGCRL